MAKLPHKEKTYILSRKSEERLFSIPGHLCRRAAHDQRPVCKESLTGRSLRQLRLWPGASECHEYIWIQLPCSLGGTLYWKRLSFHSLGVRTSWCGYRVRGRRTIKHEGKHRKIVTRSQLFLAEAHNFLLSLRRFEKTRLRVAAEIAASSTLKCFVRGFFPFGRSSSSIGFSLFETGRFALTFLEQHHYGFWHALTQMGQSTRFTKAEMEEERGPPARRPESDEGTNIINQ